MTQDDQQFAYLVARTTPGIAVADVVAFGPEDLERAREYASNTHGIVVAVPVVHDGR